ncbi:hypothetical protein BDV95DRAFT_25835 [Massariosphaeria phaeospora]|uniref:Uncharacterized protein n=1 Tax=Massariosphaeria phaeospora TaxID=100035 RepID=A0A7C8IFV5_9PLEO|nr:hypothetical protein BDV95DRAFT_25835 [Massariosphaeria phaeospora]
MENELYKGHRQSPGLSGPFGAASGHFSIFEDRINGDSNSGVDGVDAPDMLKKLVKKFAGSMKRDIQVTKNAIFGATTFWDATAENLVPNEVRDIPSAMQYKGGDPGVNDGWNHAITYVLGDGQWFVERPAAGLDEKFGELYQRIMRCWAGKSCACPKAPSSSSTRETTTPTSATR